MLKKQTVKKETLATFTNLNNFYQGQKTGNNSALNSAVVNFLEKRELNKHYSFLDIKKTILKDYLRIKQNEKRANERIDNKRSFNDNMDLFSSQKKQAVINDKTISLIRTLLTGKQFKTFENWIDNGLPDYKIELKAHNKVKQAIKRILTKLSGYKSLYALMTEDKALDSFTDSYGFIPYKGGNKETVKYSHKAGSVFKYDIEGLNENALKKLVSQKIENKRIKGKVIIEDKIVNKKVKSSSSAMKGYKKYPGLTGYDKKEKIWLNNINPENMVHLKNVKRNDNKKGMYYYHYCDSVYIVLPVLNNNFNLRHVASNIYRYMIKIGLKKPIDKVVVAKDKVIKVYNSKGEYQDRIVRPYGYWLTIN